MTKTAGGIYLSASADHHLDEQQLDVKRAVVNEIEKYGFDLWRFFEHGPLRKGWGFEKAIQTMAKADGAIALGFAQWKCHGLGPREAEAGLKMSEGNHFEAGLALACKVPLFVIREAGVQERGIASHGTVHLLATMPRGSTRAWVQTDGFQSRFLSWIDEIKKRRRRRVFIGHGHSPDWKDLREFIEKKLSLPWDEFNRVPIAGRTTAERLSEILDAMGLAFLVMTAEDEQADGELKARSNVIHEVGLVQGRLGFHKAIVLLEDGCEAFSNVNGLGHISFPKGNIAAAFEEVRDVLIREGLLE